MDLDTIDWSNVEIAGTNQLLTPENLEAHQEALQHKATLSSFLAAGWHAFDAASYTHGWHIDCIADHLMAAGNGEFAGKILIINIPPGMSKSSIVSVGWPAYEWARGNANFTFMCIAYREKLALRDSMRCRDLIRSAWYQRLFPHVQIRKDADTKQYFRNKAGGYRLAVPTSGVMGEGGRFCFHADTEVLTQHGAVSIRTLVREKYSMGVWSRDVGHRDNASPVPGRSTAPHQWRDVTGWHRSSGAARPMVRVALDDGTSVVCTADHRLYDAELGWCVAARLRVGARVGALSSVAARRCIDGEGDAVVRGAARQRDVGAVGRWDVGTVVPSVQCGSGVVRGGTAADACCCVVAAKLNDDDDQKELDHDGMVSYNLRAREGRDTEHRTPKPHTARTSQSVNAVAPHSRCVVRAERGDVGGESLQIFPAISSESARSPHGTTPLDSAVAVPAVRHRSDLRPLELGHQPRKELTGTQQCHPRARRGPAHSGFETLSFHHPNAPTPHDPHRTTPHRHPGSRHMGTSDPRTPEEVAHAPLQHSSTVHRSILPKDPTPHSKHRQGNEAIPESYGQATPVHVSASLPHALLQRAVNECTRPVDGAAWAERLATQAVYGDLHVPTPTGPIPINLHPGDVGPNIVWHSDAGPHAEAAETASRVRPPHCAVEPTNPPSPVRTARVAGPAAGQHAGTPEIEPRKLDLHAPEHHKSTASCGPVSATHHGRPTRSFGTSGTPTGNNPSAASCRALREVTGASHGDRRSTACHRPGSHVSRASGHNVIGDDCRARAGAAAYSGKGRVPEGAVPAGEVEPRDALSAPRVLSITPVFPVDEVYCLDVDVDHNFFVREPGSPNWILAHNCIFDDPHNIKEAESDDVREKTIDQITAAVTSRIREPEYGCEIDIMQRLHERDLVGHRLEKELDDVIHVCLPMRYDPDHPYPMKTPLVQWARDPRKEEGEVLCPDRYTDEVVTTLYRKLSAREGSYHVASQYQQRPAPKSGGMFKKKFWQFADDLPDAGNILGWASGWDLAATETKKSARTARVLGCISRNGNVYIQHGLGKKLSPMGVNRWVLECAQRDPEGTVHDFPQDPGQAAVGQKAMFARLLLGYVFQFSPESGSKEDRAAPVASQAEAGNIYLIRGGWNAEFVEELSVFPKGRYKDIADALSRMFTRLSTIFNNEVNNEVVAPMMINMGN